MRIINVDLRLLEYPLETPFYPSWLPGYPQTAHRVQAFQKDAHPAPVHRCG